MKNSLAAQVAQSKPTCTAFDTLCELGFENYTSEEASISEEANILKESERARISLRYMQLADKKL